MGPNLPTPLYASYQESWGFSAGVLTLVFAVYAVALLGGLLFFGSASDVAGRRSIMLLAIGMGAASSLVFVLAENVGLLFVARALSGLSAGLIAGAAAAALSELAPPGSAARLRVINTIATLGGSAVAALLSGLLVQYAGHPTKLVFVVYLALLLVAAIGVVLAPETVPSRHRPVIRFGGLGVPAALRADLLAAGVAAFCAFTLLGLFAALAPSLLSDTLHQSSAALAGFVVFLIFASACLSDVALNGLADRTAVISGFLLLVSGLWLIVLALSDASMAIFIAGTVVGGLGVGLVYGPSLAAVNAIAPPEHRSQVVSTYFVAANLGLIIPVIGVGVASEHIGALQATLFCAVAITALVASALVSIARSRPAAQADSGR
jgi:MFS family permease